MKYEKVQNIIRFHTLEEAFDNINESNLHDISSDITEDTIMKLAIFVDIRMATEQELIQRFTQ